MKKEINKFYNLSTVNNEAELFILSEIGEDEWYGDVTLEGFKNDLDSVEGKDLTITINSGGGNVFAGNAIANLIKKRKGNTKCVISALCASIATQIALACDEVTMYKNGFFMIHQASSIFYGNADEIEKQLPLLKAIDETLATTYADKTGMTVDECIDYMKKVSWFKSNEALELGFIDGIVENELQIVAKIDTDILAKYKNVPIDLLNKHNKSIEDKIEADESAELELLKAKLQLALL